MSHTWSIAVEVQMYVFTPPLMMVGHTLTRRGVPLLRAYLSVLVTPWVAVCVLRLSSVNMILGNCHYESSPHRAGPYLAGMAAAIVTHQHSSDPTCWPGRCCHILLALASWLILLIAASFGAELMYFTQVVPSRCSMSLWTLKSVGQPI